MDADVLIVGGGMAGLASAIATARAGARVRLLEQAGAWGEVGAGLQLGPNAVQVLADWGLLPALQACAAFPDALQARDSRDGRVLGRLPLGQRALERYGHPYATIHRADLHALLLQAAQAHAELRLNQTAARFDADTGGVALAGADGQRHHGHLLLGCDGVWSRVRQQLVGDGGPRPTGHLAYRGLVRQTDLPVPMRQRGVTAWLGPSHHVVHYPVRGGDWLNVVAVVEGQVRGDAQAWSHQAGAAGLQTALGPVHGDLQAVLNAVPDWTLWPLHDRPPMRGANEQAQGRVALLGDAAHPMRPYLAQGAAMALEDAWTLGRVLGEGWRDEAPQRLRTWSGQRWQRNAWVQARSRRNGRIFHLHGPVRWARDAALAMAGERLMDVPALYGWNPGGA